MAIIDAGEALMSLDPPVRRALELAYAGLVAGGLACGAVLVDEEGTSVAEGRNHAYDPATGADTLEGTPLAHAELNVLARVGTGRSMRADTLWTTQEPCSMCTAAAAFVEVGTVRYVAPDPWAIAVGRSRAFDESARDIDGIWVLGPLDDLWVVAANVLFMLSTARGNPEHPTLLGNLRRDPAAARLVVELMGRGDADALILPPSLEGFFERFGQELVEAATTR